MAELSKIQFHSTTIQSEPSGNWVAKLGGDRFGLFLMEFKLVSIIKYTVLLSTINQGWQFLPGAVYSRFLPWFLPSGRNYFFQFLPEESGRNQPFLEILYYFTKYLLINYL